ncbi:phage tail tip lysozyme [Acinetobacter proteolyticus]|uniref:Phage tail tape measure protein n=1 Tax=Acinetobacter proteolyticus TaxID=1776741 RepID=A0A2N0WBN8_9GAMM|nr:phage tail tip lysozyme [Acinetobacter proteolyticus]PKF31925.1 phage tail tape measure protein [Acinetobacter proteolyticus]
MADGVIRDFLVSLGFDTDNSGLANMKSAMDGIEWKAKALNGALLALATGAVLAVKQTASELDKLYFSSQRIGASVTNINAYGNAIAQLGGSAEGAVGSLESLAEKIRNSPGYEGQIKSLGVNTRDANGAMRDRVEVMKDLSGVLAKMPSYQANAYANSLGIDQNTLMAMRDGKFMANMDKYQKIQKELGMNNDLAKSGNEFMTEYRDLTMMTKIGFQVIVMQAGKALIPILRMLNQLIQAGIHAFSQLNPQIKEGLAVGLRFAMLALMFGAMAKSLGLLLKFIPAFKTFIGLLKLFRLAFLASPIGIILALGAALALLYDDYKTWKEGGKSLFDWSKWTNGIDTIINKIKDFLDILDKIKDKTIEFIQKIIKDPAGALKEVATEVQEGVTKTAEKVNDAVDKYINPTDPKKVTPTQDKVASITDFAFSMVDKGLAMFGNADAQTRVEQRERGEIGYQSVATGAAKATVDAVKGVVSETSLKTKEGRRLSVFKAFLDSGFTMSQAMALTAEVGRENEYNLDTMFGTHSDAGNSKQNLGFFSWQGDRKEKLINYLKSKNLLDETGHMLKNQGSLKAMAEFARSEIYGIKRYSKTKELFESSPNADPENYAKTLGKNYIVWAYGQDYINKGKTKFDWKAHDQRRRTNLGKLKGQIDKTDKFVLPNNSKDLARFAENASIPNGNPHKAQVNSSNDMSASNITINQNYQTDMTINGASSPVESANAIKRQQENAMTIMARGAKGIFV